MKMQIPYKCKKYKPNERKKMWVTENYKGEQTVWYSEKDFQQYIKLIKTIKENICIDCKLQKEIDKALENFEKK
jgi:hypothetical protein